MTSFPSYLITEELLSSLRKQPVFPEVKGPGFFSGVEHQGLLVGFPEPEDTVAPRVFVEMSNRPVIDRAVANDLQRKLSVLRSDGGQYHTKFLLTTRSQPALSGIAAPHRVWPDIVQHHASSASVKRYRSPSGATSTARIWDLNSPQ